MEEDIQSDGLYGLYQDLSCLHTTDMSLMNVDRLCFELESQLEHFKKLLDKPTKSNTSRQAVLSGNHCFATLEIGLSDECMLTCLAT